MITPGNWLVAQGSKTMVISDERIPCLCDAIHENAEGNARLFAASKEMLLFLINFVDFNAKRSGLFDRISSVFDQPEDVKEAISLIVKVMPDYLSIYKVKNKQKIIDSLYSRQNNT